MQAGTTGINANRIYNPVKQGKDHDPDGVFIKRFLPEFEKITITSHLHEPWKMSKSQQEKCGIVLGENYPKPIVDHAIRYKEVRLVLKEWNKKAKGSKEAKMILEKHGAKLKRKFNGVGSK